MEVFSWNDNPHSILILKSLNSMRQSQNMCDVILVAENEKLYAHKLVLCAISPYFRTMIGSNFKEGINSEIEFKGMSIEILKTILQFVYTGEIKITKKSVYALMEKAHLLQISSLKMAISHYLSKTFINKDTCIELMSYAILYDYQELLFEIQKYISDNFVFMITHHTFKNASDDAVKYILCHQNLKLSDICRGFEIWLRHTQDIDDFSYHKCTINKYLEMLDNLKSAFPHIEELVNHIKVRIIDSSPDREMLISENSFTPYEIIFAIGGSSKGTIWPNVEGVGMNMSYPMGSLIPEAEENNDMMLSKAIRTMFEPRMCAGSAFQYDNIKGGTTIYMIGGIGTAATGGALGSCEKYNSRKNAWIKMKPLPKPLKAAGVVISDDILYVTGGQTSNNQVVADVLTYYDKTDKWYPLDCESRLQEERHSHGACNVKGTIYVMGGQDSKGRILSSVERYNPDLKTWIYVTEMPEPKCEFGCVSHKEYIYVLGGSSKNLVLCSVSRYNTLTDKWESCMDMPVAKSAFGCTVSAEKIYCVGGCNIIQGPLASVEVYNINTDRWTKFSSNLNTERAYSSAANVRVTLDSNKVINW